MSAPPSVRVPSSLGAPSSLSAPSLGAPGAGPPLERRLGLFGASLFGLSYLCPTVVVSTFGLIALDSHGAAAAAYLLATLAMLLTAGSYGWMAARHPQAGSAYLYVARTFRPGGGFLVGWVLLLDYFFVPMVIALFTAKALEMMVPAIGFRWWLAAIALGTTLINARGLALTHRVNLAIMGAQLGVLGVLIGCCYRHAASSGLSLLAPLIGPGAHLKPVLSGASIAAYSFLGFDAVTTLAEETHAPTRNIPRATLIAAAVCGLLYVLSAHALSLAHPALAFADVDNGGYEVMRSVSGALFPALLLVVLIAYGASVMCAQAASARLLYALARDGWLPARLPFQRLHARWRTPLFGLAVVGAIMLIGEAVEVATAAECVNFGAFCAFFAVNASALVSGWRERRLPGAWRLPALLGPLLGAAGTLWLLAGLHRPALIAGALWSVLGLLYFAVRLDRLRSLRVPLGV